MVTARSSATLGNLPMDRRPFSSTTVHFGRRPPSDVPRPRKYSRSAAVSVFGLDRTRRSRDVCEFDERRRRAATVLGGALEDSRLVLKPKSADAARVVHLEQEVEVIQRPRVHFGSGATSFLHALRVVAEDDASAPTVGLRVRDRCVEDRTVPGLLVELRPGHELQCRVDREPIRADSQLASYSKAAFSRAPVRVVSDHADQARIVAEEDLDSASHGDAGSVFGRTRFGTRCSSSSSPCSSRLASTRSPKHRRTRGRTAPSRTRPSRPSDRPFPRARTCSSRRPSVPTSSPWSADACGAPGARSAPNFLRDRRTFGGRTSCTDERMVKTHRCVCVTD